jgi:DMSO/TMAO reductase YedYZ molybdopterin-dependent catalytic subunit
MTPRLTDWSLALMVGLAFGSGIVSLVSGRPEHWPVFAIHGMAGLALLILLWGKLRRVLPRLLDRRRWERATLFGAGALAAVGLSLGSGMWWVFGGDLFVAGFNLLNWHILIGIALVAVTSAHMLARARPLRAREVGDRRRMLRASTLYAGGAALWVGQQALDRRLGLPPRRFTGSREAGSYAANAFPSTSWVADQPRPLPADRYRLDIGGMVTTPLALNYADLLADPARIEATLDCTGGFYSTQIWQGARVGVLLDRAGLLGSARWVSFVSITGYRWSLPIAEAAGALLATHVGGEPLSHAQGAPVRLVAPGRRGFEWVKWVVRVEVRAARDLGQIASLYTSSLSPAGRGEQDLPATPT